MVPREVTASTGTAVQTQTPITVQVYASDDAFVRGGTNAETKFGATTPSQLQIKNYSGTNAVDKREAFIKFDLKGIPGVITGATLNLYGAVADGAQPTGKSVSLSVYEVSSDTWLGTEITWNASPVKGSSVASPITMLNNKPAQWYSTDVSSYIATEQLADQTASLALIDTSLANCFVSLQSMEAANKPYLTVTYMPASTADTDPPLWPAGAQLASVVTSSTSVRLEWLHAQDTSGILGYRIYANGHLLGSVRGAISSYDAVSLIPGETYEFSVEAADTALNWSHNGPQARVTLPMIEQKLVPTNDTYVNGGTKADINYGNDASLLVKTNSADLTREALLKFDLGSVIQDIGSAELYVYASTNDGGGTTVTNQLYSTDSEQWNEAETTWNSKPGVQDYLQSFTVDRTPKWFKLDVTAYVKRQSAADKAASFLIRQEVQYGLNVSMNSKENAANKPYLRISKNRANQDAPSWGDSPQLSVVKEGEDEIGVSWTPAIGADAYRIYASGVLVGTVSGSTTNYTLSGLTVGKSYTIKIEAGQVGVWSSDGPFATARTLDTKLIQTQLGNVYWSNEDLSMQLQTGRTAVSWKIADVWGSQVASGTAAPQNGAVQIPFPTSLRGYFTLKVLAESENRNPLSLETSFTVLTPFDVSQLSDSPFGVNTHFTWTSKGWSPTLTRLIAKAGIKNVREASEWGSVEKQKGVYTVPVSPVAAEYQNDFREKSLDQLWVLAFTNPLYDSNSTPYTDEGREGFANHAKAILDAYNGADATAPSYTHFLKQVEVYNEFNIGFGDRGTGPADSKPEYYFPILKKTYETVKSAHPDTIVSGMSTAGVPMSWLESVMKLGGLNYMDALTIHPYVYPKDPELLVKSIKDVNDLVRKYNGGNTIPLWLSEIGWPTHNSLSGVSEKKSADDLVRGYVLSLANGVEKIYWYDLMNDGVNKSNNEDNFGLIRNKADELGAYTPKPAFTAYAVMIRQLSGASFNTDLSAAGSYYHYLFKKGSEDVRAAWAVQPRPVAIGTQTPIRIVDYMGNETVYTPVRGKVHLTLNSEPIYIHGAIESMQEDRTFVLAGETSLIREEGKLKLSVTNTDNVPLSGMIEVNGRNYPFAAAANATANLSIQVPGQDHEGSMSVRGRLTSADGNPLGLVYADIPFRKPFTVELKPFLAAEPGIDPTVQVIIDNHALATPLELAKIDWSIGQLSGTVATRTIAPSSSAVESIPLPGFVEGVSYPLDVTIVLAGYDPIPIVSSLDFNRVAYRGGADEPVPILLSSGTNRIQAGSYTGPDDLSGSFNLSWDETNFYLEADIVDDVFKYPFVGQEIYKNDSIQFGMAGGIPGMVTYNYEIGISQTPQGPQIYFYNGPEGIPLGIHDNGDMDLKVSRDEEHKVTKYRLMMPWREFEPILPTAGNVISFSMLVNENDAGSREGYIEWGSGIGGAKDPTKFRAFQMMAPDDYAPPTSVAARITANETILVQVK
nr:DNRLRE domain-containing protein [Paenibacillus alba]